jgi:hypothetical protein
MRVPRILYRLGLVEDVWSERPNDLYLRRVFLTPRTRWGQLRIHYFFRGDNDQDPHDHRWDFWTIPLCRNGYLESVPDGKGVMRAVQVKGFRPYFRAAEYAHLVMGRCLIHNGLHEVEPGPFASLVWIYPKRRDWGFYPFATRAVINKMIPVEDYKPGRIFVPWRTYLAKRDPVIGGAVDKTN